MSRILLMTRVNPADNGGVQAVFRRLAESLRRRGHTVRVVWTRPDPLAAGDTCCVPLPPLPHSGIPTGVRPLAGAMKAALRLGRAISQFRPDVVNYHFITGEALYLAWLKPLLRFRLVLSAHGSDVLRPKEPDAALLPAILRRAETLTAVSRLTASRLADGYAIDRERIAIIPNGVDSDFWSPLPDARPLQERPPAILSAGRLHPVKGHDVLLRAFALLMATRPDARLTLAGDGGSRAELESLAATLGVTSRVDFIGQLAPAGIRERMSQARCFALPSRSEGLPLALLEAMSAGLPVVVTRVGGVPEVVDESTAILVPPEAPEPFAAGLERALDVSVQLEQMVTRARARARQFSASGADDAYACVLDRGLPEAPGA